MVSTPVPATASESIAKAVVAPATPMVHVPVTVIAMVVTEPQGPHIAQGRGTALPTGHTWVPSVHATAVGLVDPAGQ